MNHGKFLIIDGSSLVYRAFFALPLLQTRQGFYTNAVYGFTTMLLRLLDEEKPAYVAVAFDKEKITFRHARYAEYKAKREKTPSELTEQFTYVREVLAGLGIAVVEEAGFEADDLIGTLAVAAHKKGLKPVIVSGDADVLQLVDTPAEVIYTRRGITQVERFTEKELHEKHGLTARQFIDFKGLKGDTSDNIPGVPGVGEKTALKLLSQYGSLEGIYEHLGEITGKLQTMLDSHKEQAFLSRELATIVTTAPLTFTEDKFTRQETDYSELRKLFTQLEFKSLLDKLPSGKGPANEMQETVSEEPFQTVHGDDGLTQLHTLLQKAESAAILMLPYGVSWQEDPRGIAVALETATFYLPTPDRQSLIRAVSFLMDQQLLYVVYDGKNWLNLCVRTTALEPRGPVFDVSLAAYLLDPLENGYPPEKMAERYLERKLPEVPAKNADADCEENYSCAAARALFDLQPVLQEKLREFELSVLYDELELPLSATLARMEAAGVAVDLKTLAAMREEIKERISVLEGDIFRQAGETFNLNSPKQLGHILFDKLGLPVLKKTKTGYSTDAQVLEELAPHHAIVENILQYRTLIKLLGTYLEGLSKLVSPETGRIHTTFNQTVTATGRLSSTEPNLQNIPIRLEEGRRIRRAFIPGKKGFVLLSADYSQIELRILAHISGDSVLIDSFRNEEDIHQRTAAEVFGVAPEDVTKELRDRAKAVNFGIIYGISDYGLSRQLGISRQEAKTYISRYLERLPAVQHYIDQVIKEARKNGYVTTILNRRRYLPEINAKNFNLRGFAERTAMNTPIQGSAADIIKLAMLRVEEALAPYEESARMILQVHDELVFEVAESCLPAVSQLIRSKMQSAINLAVPLTVDVKYGRNWAQMEIIKE